MGSLLEKFSFELDFSETYLSQSCFWRGHIPSTSFLLQVLQPRRIVELGVHHGDSLFAFAQSADRYCDQACSILGIDAWEGDIHTGAQENWIYERVHKLSQDFGSRISLNRAYFHEAAESIPERSIDLLHIDGMHTYDAVKADFDCFLKKMSSQGVILFHDICVYKPSFGVWKLWEELTEQYPHFSFTHSCGLGVLAVGDDLPSAATELFNASDIEKYNLACVASIVGKQFAKHNSAPSAFEKVSKIGELSVPMAVIDSKKLGKCLHYPRW